MQLRSEYIIQVLLLGAVVIACTGNCQSKLIAIKFQARIVITDYNRCVVNAKKEISRLGEIVPFLQAFSFRKLQNFKNMIVEVLKIKGLDSGGRRNVSRQCLRPGGCMAYIVCS